MTAKVIDRKKGPFHLPDCNVVQWPGMACDCGAPPHPLPGDKALVRRKRKGERKPRLVVIPRSQLKRRERDYS